MQIVIPVFFIFTIYSFINTYLPLVLVGTGFSVSQIGLLMSIFDFSGTFVALFCTSFIQKKKKYGISLLILTIPCILLPTPIITVHNFWISAVALAIYAVGYKCLIPVSDTVINNILGDKQENYGKIRVVGSFSFVLMALIMQVSLKGTLGTPIQTILWMTAPALLTAISFFCVPGLISGKTGNSNTSININESNKVDSLSNKKIKKNIFTEYSASYWSVLLLLLISFFALSPINKFFSLYVTDFLHINSAPLLWAMHAVVEIPVMFFSGKLIKKFGNTKLLCVCVMAVSVRLLIYIIFPSLSGAIFGQLFNAFTFGLLHPAAISFISEHVPSDKQVTGLALYTVGANGIGNIVGSAIGGIIIDTYGFQTLFLSAACLPPIGVAIFLFQNRKNKLK